MLMHRDKVTSSDEGAASVRGHGIREMRETVHPRGAAGGRARQVDGQQHEGAARPGTLDDCLSVFRLGPCGQRC